MASEYKAEEKTLNYIVRECATLEDFSACLEMQRRVWQFSDLDITPLRSFVIARRSGGFTLGAFDPVGRLLGFAHALAAFDEKRRPYFYSHMLAVERELQNCGDRRPAEAGAARPRDGARRPAAHLDVRPAAIAQRLSQPRQARRAWSGPTTSTITGTRARATLHRGLDTDRLFVEWWAGSGHVAETLAGRRRRRETGGGGRSPPREIGADQGRDSTSARWQSKSATAFRRHLGDGLYCAGFEAGRRRQQPVPLLQR